MNNEAYNGRAAVYFDCRCEVLSGCIMMHIFCNHHKNRSEDVETLLEVCVCVVCNRHFGLCRWLQRVNRRNSNKHLFLALPPDATNYSLSAPSSYFHLTKWIQTAGQKQCCHYLVPLASRANTVHTNWILDFSHEKRLKLVSSTCILILFNKNAV